MKVLKLLLFAAVLLAAGAAANADVLWDQSYDTGTLATWYSGNCHLGLATLEESSVKANDFQLDATSNVTKVTFWTITDGVAPITASVTFFSDNSGYPAAVNSGDARPVGWTIPGTAEALSGALPWYAERGVTTYAGGDPTGWIYRAVTQNLTVTAVDTVNYGGDRTVYKVEIELPEAFVAQAGTIYWAGLSLSSEPYAGLNNSNFGIMCTTADLLAGSCENGSPQWGGGYDFFMTIEGTVPEPATIALLGLGSVGVLLRRRSK